MTTATGMSEREAREHNGYLTTTGRVTGRSHEIEIWFAVDPDSAGQTVYLLAGGRARSDWVKNLGHDPAVTLRAGAATYRGAARIVAPDEPIDGRAREVVATKYGARTANGELTNWARTSLPVVIELDGMGGGRG